MTVLTQHRAKRRTALIAASVAALMIGAAYASVPLYRIFCAATGYDGTPVRDTVLPDAAAVRAVAGRTIKVRFDGNVAPGMAWRFGPKDPAITVKIGQKNMAMFTATNLSDKPVTGRAAYNVSPDIAGLYFHKIACFCFDNQTLQPGQTVDMPVTFFVDPSIVRDKQAVRIDEITLSYTFFPVDNAPVETVSRTATITKG